MKFSEKNTFCEMDFWEEPFFKKWNFMKDLFHEIEYYEGPTLDTQMT